GDFKFYETLSRIDQVSLWRKRVLGLVTQNSGNYAQFNNCNVRSRSCRTRIGLAGTIDCRYGLLPNYFPYQYRRFDNHVREEKSSQTRNRKTRLRKGHSR